MKVLYNVVLLDCLRLLQNFNDWKARMCTKSMRPKMVTSLQWLLGRGTEAQKLPKLLHINYIRKRKWKTWQTAM